MAHGCVLATAAQIHPGHAVLEGRKPALLDSLVQVGGRGHRVWAGGWVVGTHMWEAGGAGTAAQCCAKPHDRYGLRTTRSALH